VIELPFGEYESYEDCVAKNQDKKDPAAYCGTIQHAVEEGLRRKPLKLQTMSQEQIKAKIAEISEQVKAKQAIAFPVVDPQIAADIDALWVQKRGYEDALATLAEEEALALSQQGTQQGVLPVKLRLFAESIRCEGNRVSGVALHPKRLWHPEEGQAHLFLKEELKKSAPSLGGKSFGIDHLRLLPKPNMVEKAWYDEQENGVAFEGNVDDQVKRKIKEGAFKGLSIELDWFKDGVMTERIGGAVAPRNFDFTSVHFMSQFPPADKETFVKLWEGIMLPIVPPPFDVQIDQLRQAFEERVRYLEGQFSALTRADTFSSIPQAQAAPVIIILKEAETKIGQELTRMKATIDQLKTLKEAYLTQNFAQNAAVAEKEKRLRIREGEFDVALGKIAEKLGAQGPKEGEALVEVRKKLVEAEGKGADLEKQMKQGVGEAKQKYLTLHKAIVESIPPSHVWKCWTFGPKMMISQQMRALGIAPDDRQ